MAKISQFLYTMEIRQAFKFKLKTKPSHDVQLAQFAGCARWTYNHLLGWSRDEYRQGNNKAIGRSPMYKEITACRHSAETSWLAECHTDVLQYAADTLIESYRRFWKGLGGYPQFKRKKAVGESFTYKRGVKVAGKRVYLPKIGWLRFFKSREIVGQIKYVTVSKKVSGWYISFSTIRTEPDPLPTYISEETAIGIDVGLSHFYTDSDGHQVDNPRHFSKWEHKLARAQRKLSRCQKGSRNGSKQRQRVAKIHERITNQRQDFLHKLTSQLTNENQVVITEDLSVKGLARTQLAKSVLDASWHEFFRQLCYKSAWKGGVYHQIDRFFPSSKTCFSCQTVQEISLSDRQFVCTGCGVHIHRDWNAAKNIKAKGLADLAQVAVGHTETKNACVRMCNANTFHWLRPTI